MRSTWRERAECHENYLSTTGEGSGDPHYTWGALMALIAVEEIVDANPWHGLRFGNLAPVEAGAIERYAIAGALYDIELSNDGLLVDVHVGSGPSRRFQAGVSSASEAI
jgi:hypothetical protein